MAGWQRATKPDLDLILETIRDILEPSPAWTLLPKLLQLFAHLQLVSARVSQEAHRALRQNARYLKRLEREVPENQLKQWGVILKQDGEALDRLATKDTTREDSMMDLSFRARLIVSSVGKRFTWSALTH